MVSCGTDKVLGWGLALEDSAAVKFLERQLRACVTPDDLYQVCQFVFDDPAISLEWHTTIRSVELTLEGGRKISASSKV